MRLLEFEAREILRRAGIPVTDSGLATEPAEARRIAERIGGPTALTPQLSTGEPTGPGERRLADTPEQAEAHARDLLAREVDGDPTLGVLVEARVEVEQEHYAGLSWDTTRKRPVMVLSPVGGDDVERVAAQQPERVGRRHFSTLLPFSAYQAREVVADTGLTGAALDGLAPIVERLALLFLEHDLTLAELDPLGRLADGSFVALGARLEVDDAAHGRQPALLRRLGAGDEVTRQLAGAGTDATGHRDAAHGSPAA